MRLFGYPYNDLVICKDSPDYLIMDKITFDKLAVATHFNHFFSNIADKLVSKLPPVKGIYNMVNNLSNHFTKQTQFFL